MDRVAATLTDDGNLIGAVAILCGIAVGQYFELLNRILRQNYRRRLQSRIGIDQAVEHVVIGFGAATVNADGIALPLSKCRLLAAGRNCAGSNKEKAQEVAAV